jgi:hypothetical protein
MAFIQLYNTGIAAMWSRKLFSSDVSLKDILKRVMDLLQKSFSGACHQISAADCLLKIKQGVRTFGSIPKS